MRLFFCKESQRQEDAGMSQIKKTNAMKTSGYARLSAWKITLCKVLFSMQSKFSVRPLTKIEIARGSSTFQIYLFYFLPLQCTVHGYLYFQLLSRGSKFPDVAKYDQII